MCKKINKTLPQRKVLQIIDTNYTASNKTEKEYNASNKKS